MKKSESVEGKAPKRVRQKKNLTLSPTAIAMGEALAEYEGAKFSQLIERWIREAFREGGLDLAEPQPQVRERKSTPAASTPDSVLKRAVRAARKDPRST